MSVSAGRPPLLSANFYANSAKTQVLCITHLPQVAAYGHHHFRVSKLINKKTTRSVIEPLDFAGRTQELARMLGGENITQQTLSHASKMLQIS